MLSKILSTAILIVVAWTSLQLMQTQRALQMTQVTFHNALEELRTDVQAEINDSAIKNEAVGSDVIQRMEELSAEQVKLAKAASKGDPKLLKAKDQTIARLNQTASLQEVVVNVFKADLLGKESEGEQAAELLLSTKSSIWKLSEKWGKSKDALRGLMGPIDVLASKWKGGDYSTDTKKIQQVLQEIMSAQAQS